MKGEQGAGKERRPGQPPPGADPAAPDVVDRWDLLWWYLPLVFVAIPTAVSLTNAVQPAALLLSAVTAGWYGYMVLAHKHWAERLLPMSIYYTGLVALTTALVQLDDAFFLMLFGTFFQAFMLLRGIWAYVGVTVSTAVLWFVADQSFVPEKLPNMLLSLALTFAIGGTMRAITNQSTQRHNMITELEETGRKLAALAEENADLQAQLLSQAKESGVQEERQRMAREIHDTLAQGLIGIITHLEAAGQVVEEPRLLRPRMATAQQMARDSLAEARRSVQALRPAALAGAALPDALAKVTEEWSRTSGVPAELTLTGDARPMHPEVEVTLLRTAQEALANIAKHASAGRAGLTLSYMEDVVALDIRDDGAGFDPAAHEGRLPDSEGGFGLTAMRQRVARLTGSLVIESAPGHGTGISATVPAILAPAGHPAGHPAGVGGSPAGAAGTETGGAGVGAADGGGAR